MNVHTAASQQWQKRPADECFASITDLDQHFGARLAASKAVVVSSRKVEVQPDPANPINGLQLVGPNGHPVKPTHWAFGQLCQRVEAPAGYLRRLPAPLAADNLNYGLQTRDVEDMGCLLYRNGDSYLRACTGPDYGRIWDHSITQSLLGHGIDGITGQWQIPGYFGGKSQLTATSTADEIKAHTTVYAGDRDMFIFLASADKTIQVKNRRNGQSGTLHRGFIVTNSETGASRFRLIGFFFDEMCCNHLIWGIEGQAEVAIRHTASAPDRWLEEAMPALKVYAESSTASFEQAIEKARAQRLGDALDSFLKNRFGPRMVPLLKRVHQDEEQRPIETAWDVVTAATAYARELPHQDARLDLEMTASKILVAA